MNTQNFDPTKPVQTRDGKKARIICMDAKIKGFPLISLITNNDGKEYQNTHTVQGRNFIVEGNFPSDLINIPEERTLECWISITEYGPGSHRYTLHTSEASAKEYEGKFKSACLHIKQTYKVGEGL